MLSLPLPTKSAGDRDIWTLAQCLNKFKENRGLEGFKCDSCSEEGAPSHTIGASSLIEDVPDYLALQVMRMECELTRNLNGRVNYSRRKRMDTVKYPEMIDLAAWTNSPAPQMYELYSIVEHKGKS